MLPLAVYKTRHNKPLANHWQSTVPREQPMPASRQRKLADGRKQATESAAEIDSESNSESESDSESAGPGSSGRARGSTGDKGGPRAVDVVCPGCRMAFPSSIALRRHINSPHRRSVACGFARLKQRRPILRPRRSSPAQDSNCTDLDISDLFDDAMAEGNNYDVSAGSRSRGGLPSRDTVSRVCTWFG